MSRAFPGPLRPPVSVVVRKLVAAACAVGLSVGAGLAPARASRLIMKDGREIRGALAPLSSVINTPQTQNLAKTMVLVDDGLRRTFVPQRQVQQVDELDAGTPVESFEIPQQVSEAGMQVAAVGQILRVTPFDQYGRRILAMVTNRGVEEIIQGITQITPEWTKIECIDVEKMHYVWDMRIATTSIPRDTLDKILHHYVDPKNLDHRLKIVGLYLQSRRFADAEAELKGVLADFPNLSEDQKRTFERTSLRLRQSHAQRLLEEIETRRKAGQHRLCYVLLDQFPADDVAGETLVRVRELIDEYKQIGRRREEAIARLDALLGDVKATALRIKLVAAIDEIKAELSINNLDRLAAFMQFHSAAELSAEEKLALAVSGWLAGADYAVRNLPTALSMFDVRNLVRSYLAEPIRLERDKMLADLKRQEAFTPELVARLLAVMKPPVALPAAEEKTPGFYRLEVENRSGEPPVEYLVQLPREYDPHRRYPLVVTMHAAGTTPEQQIDWWAGPVGADGLRLGHADRNGYIVLAPRWAKEAQTACEYAEHEHAAVLLSLRDAYRRFSIDTDRVFLSGHSMGGDAAWDVAVSHPDLWAGLIAVTPQADKTVNFYKENAEYVPTYFVAGEMDGLRWVKNATYMDWYLTRGYNTTLVQYRGRGHEHFLDEVIRIFDWMGRQKRDFFPRKFNCRAARPNDFFFWWVEIDPASMPERALVDPADWPPKDVTLLFVEGALNAKNGVNVKTQAGRATVWLSPEIVNFKLPTDVTIRGAKANKGKFVEPDAAVMLEDARTRSDRQHPFWAKVESGN